MPAPVLPAPLWAVLLFTFVASLGTGAVTNGVFFLAKSGYGFDRGDNALLGAVFGVAYVSGALLVGKLVRRLRRAGCSTRQILAGSMGIAASVLGVPYASVLFTGTAGPWTIWVLTVVYAFSTGVLWPVVESYLSGGRSQARLRTAISQFNITWAMAVAAAFWLMAPFWTEYPIELLAAAGVLHGSSCLLVAFMGREPAPHPPEHAHGVPPGYRALLRTARAMLVCTYLFMSTLGPLLPNVLERLRVDELWQTPLGSVWQVSRVALFAMLGLWHGWHGRAWPLWWAAGLVVCGFAGVVLAPNAALLMGENAGLVAVGAGLVAFGIGLASIYKSALYYGLEVGAAQVDAGGSHEALIGAGYTIGPACLLLVDWGVESQRVPESDLGMVLTGLVVVAAGLVFALVLAGTRPVAPKTARRDELAGEPTDGG